MSKHYLARHFRERFNESTEQRHAWFKIWLASEWKPFTLREVNFMSRYVRMFTQCADRPSCLHHDL